MEEVEKFIKENVNTGRGAYSPDEVAQFVRRAWLQAQRVQREQDKKAIEEQDSPRTKRDRTIEY